MARIQFENGMVVNFDGNPTPQDVEEVASSLNLSSSHQKISDLVSANEQAQAEAGKSTARRFLSELPGQATKALIGNPARLFASAGTALGDIPNQLRGRPPANVQYPEFMGGTSFQNEFAQNTMPNVEQGRQSLPSAALDIAQVPFAGGEALGLEPTIAAGVKNAVNVGRRVFGKTESQLADKAFQEALSISRPKITPTLEEEAFGQGRVGKQGRFSGAPIAPSEQETKIAEAVQPLVEQGLVKEGAAPAVNRSAIQQRITQINNGVRAMFAKAPPQKMTIANNLRSKIDAAKSDLQLVFASDPTKERVYNAVADKFMEYAKGKDALSLLEARQDFDKVPAVKKLLETEVKGENTRKEIVLTIRRAANEFLSDLLPKNNPYRAALKQESYLIQAMENMGTKIKGISQAGKYTPFLKRVARYGAGVGLGIGGYEAARHLLP